MGHLPYVEIHSGASSERETCSVTVSKCPDSSGHLLTVTLAQLSFVLQNTILDDHMGCANNTAFILFPFDYDFCTLL